jgi:hypothetical protein
MAVYSVSYDLNKAGQNYEGLITEIKNFSDYRKVMDSYWFVCSLQDAQTVYSKLAKHIDRNDRLLVMQTSSNRQGWLDKDVWEWFKKQEVKNRA